MGRGQRCGQTFPLKKDYLTPKVNSVGVGKPRQLPTPRHHSFLSLKGSTIVWAINTNTHTEVSIPGAPAKQERHWMRPYLNRPPSRRGSFPACPGVVREELCSSGHVAGAVLLGRSETPRALLTSKRAAGWSTRSAFQ